MSGPDASASTVLPLHKAAGIGLGNALEFYDFITYGFFSIQIGRAFFPFLSRRHRAASA